MSRFVRYMVVLGLLLLVCAPGWAQHDGQQVKKYWIRLQKLSAVRVV